mmetsp:Transcript_108287/g.209634  ORF Transcript_108287/g.209634 Transcript_108287/m.209634 type:complete len:375 (-) Transcript_108287:32-1156(-)
MQQPPDSEQMIRLTSQQDSAAVTTQAAPQAVPTEPVLWQYQREEASLTTIDEHSSLGCRSLARTLLSRTLTAMIVFVVVLAPCLLFSPGSRPTRWPELLQHQLAAARRPLVGGGVAPANGATTQASVRPVLFEHLLPSQRNRLRAVPEPNPGASSANPTSSVENAEEKDELGEVPLQHVDEDKGVEWESPAEQEPPMVRFKEPIIKKRVQGQMEWEVVFNNTPVKVRRWKALSSEVLGTHKKGDVIVGRREGWWVKMLNRQGYIKQAIVHPPKRLLKQRKVSYAQLVVGSCTDAGMYPIHDLSVCHAAGLELGHHPSGGINIKVYSGRDTRPEGCYVLRDGELWVAKHPANRGHGASRLRMPVCSSRPPDKEFV